MGEVPLNPGFCIPKPSLGLGFFKLLLNGDLRKKWIVSTVGFLVKYGINLAVPMEEPTVEPLVDPKVVEVVFMEAMEPLDAPV